MRAMHDAHTSTGQARQATRLRQVALERLGAVQSRLPDADALTRNLEDRAFGEVANSQDKNPVAPLPGSARAAFVDGMSIASIVGASLLLAAAVLASRSSATESTGRS